MPNASTAPPSAWQLTRAYLTAALLVPPRGMKLGWQMPGQPLVFRLLLFVLPAIAPVTGTISLLKLLLE